VIASDDSPRGIDEVSRDLAMIGLDRLAGYFGTEVIDAWTAEGRTLGTIRQMNATELAAALERDEVDVLDVRGRSEWDAGHLPGAPNIPVGHLTAHMDEISTERPVVLYCQGGSRSAIAASVLRARGVENVVNLTGGFGEWSAAGHPVNMPRAIFSVAAPAHAP
jgi:hydroxyacylglutathione hydrolase